MDGLPELPDGWDFRDPIEQSTVQTLSALLAAAAEISAMADVHDCLNGLRRLIYAARSSHSAATTSRASWLQRWGGVNIFFKKKTLTINN